MMSSIAKGTTRAALRTGTDRGQINDRNNFNLSSTTRQRKVNEKAKREFKTVSHQARHQMPHENAGIVSSKQLDAIRSIVKESNERRNTKENGDDVVHYDIHEKTLSKADDAIINSVMQQVAQLNKNRLSEESLVKVLTSVYLDAKVKLTERDPIPPVSTVSCDEQLTTEQTERVSEKLTGDSGVNRKTPEREEAHFNTEQHLSFGERKRLQWERERAEQVALTAQDPWSKSSANRSSTAIQSLPAPSPVDRSQVADSVTRSCSGSSFSLSHAAPPALTPMAFAVHEEAELQKREDQRRQWKAELDRQVLEQRMLQEKLRLEEQRKNEALLNQMRLQPLELQSHVAAQLPTGNTTLLNNNTSYPVLGPTEAHPSASHFATTTTAFAPTSSLSPMALNGTSLASAPLSSTLPLDSAGLGALGSINAIPASRTAFNKTRGFTQQLYVNPVEQAERTRRAFEARMINLQQIEEKRRQREEEKARKLLEEKREEERIAREQAQMKAIADAEDAARRQREEAERHQVEQLHQSLFEARKAAEQQKSLRFAMHARPGVVPSSTSGIPLAPVATAPVALTQCAIPDSTQSAFCAAEPTGGSMGAPPLMTQYTALSCMNTTLMPPQVPMVSSSGVQTASVEDAEIQTEPTRQTTTISNGLVPRCALQRGTAPRRSNEQLNEAQSNQRGSDGATGVGTRRPGVPAATNRRTATELTTQMAKTQTKGIPERQTASRNVDKSSTQPRQRQQAGLSNRGRGRNGAGIGSSGAGDVAEADYRRTAYTQSRRVPNYDPSEGFVPYHRPESRQRRHTGFSPPPELPEPQSQRKKKATVRKQSEAPLMTSTNPSSPGRNSTRIPVPTTQSLRDQGPPSGHAQLDSDRQIRPANSTYLRDPLVDRTTGFGSVDLVRTHDVLNPLEADGSLPVSREPSASIQARKAHLKNSNPALYGDPPVQSTHPPTTTKRTPVSTTAKNHSNPSDLADPLLNPNMVRDHPTPRQDTILRHLSDIRKGLKLKQMLYESGNYDDEDD